MEFLTMALWFLGATGAVALVIFLARKFNITKKEADFGLLFMEVVNYINSKIDWKYSGSLSDVVTYVTMALKVVKEQGDAQDFTQLRKLVLIKAELICEMNKIKVDADFLRLLNAVIDVILTKEQETK
jgi:hypothetical protein